MRKNIKSGIYCIENLTTNKKYIGQSKNIDDRWCKHKNELNNGVHDNDYLQKAWNKYGENDFSFYILELCAYEELDNKEIYYIDLYDTLNRNHGYNLKSGGQNGGSTLSDYSRQKLKDAIKESYNDELIEKRRNDALKQWSNLDVKAKIIGENNCMYGKHHTEEAKNKISEKAKGRISSQRNTNKIICVELNKVFDCAADAAKEFLVQSGSILQVCYGKRKTCGGYHWNFYLENNI